MKIHDFGSSTAGGMARISATVTWEDSAHDRQEIYMETNACFADDLNCNPNAFLLAAVIPAMRRGERRVLVDGVVCPQLRNGLITAMQILERWYGKSPQGSVTIEATQGFEPRLPRQPSRTASFMSGGVDSLTTLRCNRLDFPLDHPGSIRDCFFVYGFDMGFEIDMGDFKTLDKSKENFELVVSSLAKLAEEAKTTLIPVYWNIRCLNGDSGVGQLFVMQSHGAALGAVAHAFSRRITTATIGSSYNIRELEPWGSHPLLDPNYSSAEVYIQHDGARFSRLEKVGLIAEWDAALKTLRTCGNPLRPGDLINCGRCEKCLRTMVELVAYDKLKQCKTFPLTDVSAEMLQALNVSFYSESRSPWTFLTVGNECHWRHLLSPLKRIGRIDLVEVIEAKLAEYERWQKRLNRKDALKRLDSRYLGERLARMKRRIRDK